MSRLLIKVLPGIIVCILLGIFSAPAFSDPCPLYDTEMLSLDLRGSSPFPLMIRESPTLASTGKTSIACGSPGMMTNFFDVFVELSLDGGLTWSPAGGPAAGPSRTVPHPGPVPIDTELIQLDLHSSAPLHVSDPFIGPWSLRESPTQPSLGHTNTTTMPDGSFHIDSFFDVFTELSLDGGATWMPLDKGTMVETTTVPSTTVPEPSSLMLLASALAGLAGIARRRM